MKTETYTIHTITADDFGYPIAKWTGSLGSFGETRLGDQGADAPGWDKIEALVAADTAEDGIDHLDKMDDGEVIDLDKIKRNLDTVRKASAARAKANNPPWSQF